MPTKKAFPTLLFRYGFPLAIFCATLLVCIMKITALDAWQYTSDIFSYDQFLNEMVFSAYPVDFTYGNLMGDHAYFYLYLLAPLKLILKNYHIYLLLILNPLAFFGSTLIFFSLIRQNSPIIPAVLSTTAYLAGFGILYRGLLEGIYGFHPDIMAGFILLSATCCFLLYNNSPNQNKAYNYAGIVFSILFMIIKEEMALIGLIYFLILFYFTRKRTHLALAIFSAIITVVGFIFINYSRTPFNRTNTALFSVFFTEFQEDGIAVLIHNPKGSANAALLYWGVLLISFLFFHLVWYKRKNINPYIIALYYAGLIKSGLSPLLFDFDLSSWHNLPGLMMIAASILLLFTVDKNHRKQGFPWLLAGIFIASCSMFFLVDTPYLLNHFKTSHDRMEFVNKYRPQLELLSEEIEENRIVSIPMFSPVEFIGHRFSFYPSGIFLPPIGIADYAIIPTNVSHLYTGNFENLYPIDAVKDQFTVISRTKHFLLYKRIQITQSDQQSRTEFFSLAKLTQLDPLP